MRRGIFPKRRYRSRNRALLRAVIFVRRFRLCRRGCSFRMIVLVADIFRHPDRSGLDRLSFGRRFPAFANPIRHRKRGIANELVGLRFFRFPCPDGMIRRERRVRTFSRRCGKRHARRSANHQLFCFHRFGNVSESSLERQIFRRRYRVFPFRGRPGNESRSLVFRLAAGQYLPIPVRCRIRRQRRNLRALQVHVAHVHELWNYRPNRTFARPMPNELRFSRSGRMESFVPFDADERHSGMDRSRNGDLPNNRRVSQGLKRQGRRRILGHLRKRRFRNGRLRVDRRAKNPHSRRTALTEHDERVIRRMRRRRGVRHDLDQLPARNRLRRWMSFFEEPERTFRNG